VVLDWLTVGAVVHAKTLAVFQLWAEGRAAVEGSVIVVVVGGRDVGVRSVGEGRFVFVEGGDQRRDDWRLGRRML